MKKLTWNDGMSEKWENDEFDTEEECLRDADGKCSVNDSIFIGEVEPFRVWVDAFDILDRLEDEVNNQFDTDWSAYDSGDEGIDEVTELGRALSVVVASWLKKHNRLPVCGSVERLRMYKKITGGSWENMDTEEVVTV